MEDIRIIVDRVLCEAFPDLSVDAEINKDPEIPDRFIIYQVVSEMNIKYANGRPIRKRSNIDVKFLCRNVNDKTIYPALIEQALLNAGFTIRTGQQDIDTKFDDEFEEGYYGTTTEFQLEREIEYGTAE